jgi:hypothetical protein
LGKLQGLMNNVFGEVHMDDEILFFFGWKMYYSPCNMALFFVGQSPRVGTLSK